MLKLLQKNIVKILEFSYKTRLQAKVALVIILRTLLGSGKLT